MNTITWIAPGLLAVAMLGTGGMKLAKTMAQLQESGSMDWVEDFPRGKIKGIGALAVMAALGLVLPATWTSHRTWSASPLSASAC